jgi:hypothetical protein
MERHHTKKVQPLVMHFLLEKETSTVPELGLFDGFGRDCRQVDVGSCP